MSKLSLHLRHKDDMLVIEGDAVEELVTVIPALADVPHLARFFSAFLLAETAGTPAASAPASVPPPSRPASQPTVLLTPEQVEEKLHSSSRTKDLANDERPAGAGLRLLVSKKTGTEPPENMTVAEAKAVLKEVNA